MYAIHNWVQTIPTFNHFLVSMTPWAHLLNNGSSRPACLFTTWLKKLLNFAQMTLLLPLNVEVALQWRCFLQGLIHSPNTSQPFSLEIFDRTFCISVQKKKKEKKKMYIILTHSTLLSITPNQIINLRTRQWKMEQKPFEISLTYFSLDARCQSSG